MARGGTDWLTIDNGDGAPTQIAYQQTPGDGPAILWLGGFRSDMTGTKAQALATWAERRNRSFTRFDYRGHGQSGGDFERLGIGDWRADALTVLNTVTSGPVVLVGSSMGGWISLLAALAQPERVAGMILIAPAPDFTQRLMWESLPETARRAILDTGRYERPSAYGDGPYVITRTLIESGRAHGVLHQPIPIAAPVRILHGMQDPDVPWQLSLELADRLQSADVQLSFVKGGDHRLSTPSDLALLERTLEGLLTQIG